MAWPNFIAPPLSSPSVLKSCSAVRCWISVMTVSAGAPPIRFPSPIADLPAYPSGSAASLAVRAAALRGRSAMGQVSMTRDGVRDVVSASGFEQVGEAVEQQVDRELELGLAVAPAEHLVIVLMDLGGDHCCDVG